MKRRRHIVIGDIHGCYDELSELLELVAPSENDIVISVGDVVRKGPAPDRCVELFRDHGWIAVFGNQEKKLLDLAALDRLSEEPDTKFRSRKRLLHHIEGWPLFADFEDAAFTVIHGGLLPETPITSKAIERQRETVTTLRYVRRSGKEWIAVPKGEERHDDVFWSEAWAGPRTILYGHTPREEVRRDAHAIGLDTGCVYGGKLSAAVLDHNEWSFVSVKARRRYTSPTLLKKLWKWGR